MLSIFESILSGGAPARMFLVCLLAAGLCGAVTAFLLSLGDSRSRSFLLSLVVLPIVVALVILMVNGSVGTGIAIAGAFSLVRFRSAAGRAKDITAIFLSMAGGLACAAGYVVIALLFTACTSLLILFLEKMPMRCDRFAELRVSLPESLHFADAFDDLFAEYTKSCELLKAKTSNMGSLYKLHYRIEMKDPSRTQEFLDALRCRNGNLDIAILNDTEGEDSL